MRAIDDLIDGYKVGTAGWANLQNIVIVGDGTIIPHAALPDGTTDTSERDFLSEALAAGSGQIAGAAGRSMFLSDAPYGTFTPLSIQGQIAYIPQVALGRLGGSGDTVGQAIDRFLAAGGVADPGTASKTAFESDYDFFTDAGAATTATLTGLGYAVNRLTVTDALAPWSVAQFVGGLLPAGGAANVCWRSTPTSTPAGCSQRAASTPMPRRISTRRPTWPHHRSTACACGWSTASAATSGSTCPTSSPTPCPTGRRPSRRRDPR